MHALEIRCEDVKQGLDQDKPPFHLLDCREPEEYETVHLEQAQLIPMSELASRVEELEAEKDDPVVVYCHHGSRSLRVTQWLLQQGFQDVKSMAGGIDEWALTIDPEKPRY